MLRVTKKILNILDVHQKKMIVMIGVMMLIGGVMESLSVSLMLPLITAVMDSETWRDKWYAQVICNVLHIESQRAYVVVLLVILIIIFILKNMYLLLEYYVQFSFVSRSRVRLQRRLMHRYLHKPYAFYLNSSTGEIVRIVMGDANQAFGLLTQLLSFYTEIVVSGILGITILVMSPEIGVGLVIILSVEVLLIAKVLKPVLKRSGNLSRSESGLANKWLLQSLNGIKSIKVSNREDFFEEKYGVHADTIVDIDRKQQTISSMPRLLIEAFTVTGVLLMLLIMILFGTDLVSIIPQLSAFVVAAIRLLPSISRISSAMNQVPFLEGGLDNVIHTLQVEKGEETLPEQKAETKVANPSITFTKNLTFSHIDFHYPNTDKNVLSDAEMVIRPGQSVGIVGTSGAGKTTAVDIMLGLLYPQHGQVLVDGTDISDNMVGWRKLLAYIPQSIFLMDDSVRENVAFGAHRQDIDDEKVWLALRDAQLEDLVRGMPDGLDTVIGEAGIRLSGGQRQRLGIARALYNNPEILFFDEATSALDNETETAIMESIDNLKGQKTMVIIAHRLTTIENCDIVYRVENGKIVRER